MNIIDEVFSKMVINLGIDDENDKREVKLLLRLVYATGQIDGIKELQEAVKS